MKENKFPPGWDEERVRRVLNHYEHQTEEQSLAEVEAAYEQEELSMMEIPNDLVPKVRHLIAEYQSQRQL